MDGLPDAHRLVVFTHVARHASMSAAARSLGVTTSAVSQQITTLETECGTRLIDRGARGVELTGAGRVLLERAEELVRGLDAARTTMSQLGGELSGDVRVSAIASAAAALVLPAARVLQRSAPDVRMSVAIHEPSASLARLDDGTADVALIDVYDHVPLALPVHLQVEEVLSEPLVAVLPRSAQLPRRLTLDRLRDEDWVLPPAASACGAATRHACRAVGFEPRVAWETDDMLLLVVAVSRGEGVALLPRRAVADTVAPVDVRRLADPALQRRLLLVTRTTSSQRPTVRACLDALHHVGRQAPSPDRTGA